MNSRRLLQLTLLFILVSIIGLWATDKYIWQPSPEPQEAVDYEDTSSVDRPRGTLIRGATSPGEMLAFDKDELGIGDITIVFDASTDTVYYYRYIGNGNWSPLSSSPSKKESEDALNRR